MGNWFEKTILDGIKELDEEKNNNNPKEMQLLKNATSHSERIIIRGADYER